MARVLKSASFFERHVIVFFTLKLLAMGIFLWLLTMFVTFHLTDARKGKLLVAQAEREYLYPAFIATEPCIKQTNIGACFESILYPEKHPRVFYQVAMAAEWFLQKAPHKADGDRDQARIASSFCDWVASHVETECGRNKEVEITSLSIGSEFPSAISDKETSLWMATRAANVSLNDLAQNKQAGGCLLGIFEKTPNLRDCAYPLLLQTFRDQSFPGAPPAFAFHSILHSRAVVALSDFSIGLKEHTTFTLDPQSLIAQTFESPFGNQLLRSLVLVIFIFIGIWCFLCLLAFTRLAWPRAGTALLIVFSLPPFAVALLTAHLADFDPLRSSNASKIFLVTLVGIIAGGITFDVGRRLMVLVDEEARSATIRGLEHFGVRYRRGSLVADVCWLTLNHIAITCADLAGYRRLGLESAIWLDHFVVRSAEYRLFEYLGSRTAYVVDNLIVLGLVFAVGGLVSNMFKNMIVEGDPIHFFRGITAMLIISLFLRFCVRVVHSRLFPSSKVS
jgi:hypothetical protein